MSEDKIEVKAYSGARGEEMPRSFVLRNDRIEVIQILDMWIEGGFERHVRKRFFKVKGSDNYVYRIYYDETALEWYVAL